MAVNKVEYKLDSLTANFASAGDEILIKKSNAKTIQNDVDNGVVEDLTSGQQKYLNKSLETKDAGTEYEKGEGAEEVPENEPTPEEEVEEGKNGAGGGSGGITSAGASLVFGQAILGGSAALLATAVPFGISAVTGPAFVGLGTASLISAGLFDVEYTSRLNEAKNTEDYIATMQEYLDAMNEELQQIQIEQEDATQEAEGEAQVAGENAEATQSSFMEQLTELYAQYEQAQAEGKPQEEIDAIYNQITELLTGGITNSEGEEPGTLEDLAERIGTTQEVADELFSEYTSVASFLKQGTNIGAMGVVNSAQLIASTALAIATIVKVTGMEPIVAAKLSHPLWIYPAVYAAIVSIDLPGKIMAGIGAAMMTAASTILLVKTVNEFKCGSNGNKLGEQVNAFAPVLEQHKQLAEIVAELIGRKEEATNGEGSTLPAPVTPNEGSSAEPAPTVSAVPAA